MSGGVESDVWAGSGAAWSGALDDGAGGVLWADERERQVAVVAAELADALDAAGLRPAGAALGLLADNGLPWVLADLAALALGVTLVPLPGFFTDGQLRHVAASAALCGVITDEPARVRAALGAGATGGAGGAALSCGLAFVRLRGGGAESLAGSQGGARITFTSGTTGEPKGVRLAARTLLEVARSLAAVTEIGPDDVHVSLLPLSVLLENVGGVYRGLLAGARVVVPPLARVGLSGSSAQCGEALVDCLDSTGATTAILVPQTLALLVEGLERGRSLPWLRLLGVGGAPVSGPLLARCARLGLPVFEGYGLSEAGSVVTLNAPRAHRAGTVGRPLPHVELAIAGDGEVLVRGPALLGYVGGSRPTLRADGWLQTGDLGSIDADGYLRLTGRKRSVLRTAYGRKLSPEWVERELLADPAVAAAAVFGDGLPQPWAVLVPAAGSTGACASVAAAVAAANARLPDYARIRRWLLASEPFSAGNGQLNAAGRLRREVIEAAYAPRLDRPARPLPPQPAPRSARPSCQ